MARITIKSRALGETFSFWCRDSGGYVYLEHPTDPNRRGCAGRQICYGGDLRGRTVYTSYSDDPEKVAAELAREARRWIRDRIRWMRAAGLVD